MSVLLKTKAALSLPRIDEAHRCQSLGPMLKSAPLFCFAQMAGLILRGPSVRDVSGNRSLCTG